MVALSLALFTGTCLSVRQATGERDGAFRQTEQDIRRGQMPNCANVAPFPRKISSKLPLIERNKASPQDSAKLAGIIQKTFEVPFPADLRLLMKGDDYQNFGQFICTNIDTIKMNAGGSTQTIGTKVDFSTDILGRSEAEQESSVIHEGRHCNANIEKLFPDFVPETPDSGTGRAGLRGSYDEFAESDKRFRTNMDLILKTERDAVELELRFLDRYKLLKGRKNERKSVEDADELRESRLIAETTVGQMGGFFLYCLAGALTAVAGLISLAAGVSMVRENERQA